MNYEFIMVTPNGEIENSVIDEFLLTPLTKEIATNTHSEIRSRYLEWMNDNEVTYHNSHGLFPSASSMNDYLNNLEKDNSEIVWAIVHKGDSREDVHIGNMSLQSINMFNRSAEFAVLIGEKEYWKKGITSQAARSVLHHGFMKLGLNRIWTGTSETNLGMQKVAKKLGMTDEGTFRKGIFLRGDFRDIYCYSILRSEYDCLEVRWNG